MADNTLLLKWGTLKGWAFDAPACQEALQRYIDLGMAPGAMQQDDTPAHKDALCALIDAVAANDGTIINDWSGEHMSADQAKDYVRNYGK